MKEVGATEQLEKAKNSLFAPVQDSLAKTVERRWVQHKSLLAWWTPSPGTETSKLRNSFQRASQMMLFSRARQEASISQEDLVEVLRLCEILRAVLDETQRTVGGLWKKWMGIVCHCR